MRIICAFILVLSLCSASARAGINGSIDLFPYGIDPSTGDRTTPDFGACQATVTTLPGGLQRLSFGVYARLSGATLAGISGAQCYLQGLETGVPDQLPTGWLKNVEIPVDAFAVGSIMDPNTANPVTYRLWALAFPVCQPGPLVLLAVVDLFGFAYTDFPSNHYVSVVAASPPSPPLMECPLLSLCDPPVFTQLCVSGGQLIINPAGPSCTVAVEQVTWSRVKGLYR